MSGLILKRRVGESVCIGDDIVITMLDDGRLLIDAPRDIAVDRAEVRHRKELNLKPRDPSPRGRSQ